MSSASNPQAERRYFCDCSRYCRSERTEVTKTTWYRHASYRNTLPSIPADVVAAHHGIPFTTAPLTTPPIGLARSREPEPEHPVPPLRRRRVDLGTISGIPEESDQDLGGRPEGTEAAAGGSEHAGCEFVDEVEDHASSELPLPISSPEDQPAMPVPFQDTAVPRPREYVIPANFEPRIDELKTALAFQRALENASLDNGDLDTEDLHLLRNPPTTPLLIDDKDVLLSIKLFISTSNASDQTYKNIYKDVSEDSPDRNFLSHARVKKKLAQLTGVYAIVNDMCPNSCIAYTGPFSVLESCVYCSASRYHQDRPGKQARQHFYTLPLGPQLQALWRTILGARAMKYRERRTREILEGILKNGEILKYDDICHGMDYLTAYLRGDIKPEDMVLMFATDGAQLYVDKQSDCWIYIWVILDLPPELRYKKRLILPGGFIPGPNNPKHSVSFFFSGFHHLAALQKEGLVVWDAEEDRTFVSRPFLLLGGADGPGSVHFTGLVGHHGAYPCRLYCGVKGRHKPGAPQYYPALQKPHNYDVEGCNHQDIDPVDVQSGGVDVYHQKLEFLLGSIHITDYKTRRRDTGITTLSLFSGLPSSHRLPVPAGFPGDSMHVPNLNLGELLIPLWRGTFTCASTDNVASWQWTGLRDETTWRAHGASVAACRPYIPTCFDRPPRNLAEKVNSGYKAKEWQNYFYGLAAALLHNILPRVYWQNYCKLVAAIRILHQRQITREELQRSHQLICDFHREFETLYCQRRSDRIHFIRPCLHALIHMPSETVRVGPVPLHATWTIERMIGDLGGEINQPSNPYQNLSERGLRRSQLNSLKASYPAFQEDDKALPQFSEEIGDGYAFLRAKERTPHFLEDTTEAEVVKRFFIQQEALYGNSPDDNWHGVKIARWARLRLPNGQTARSSWKEERAQNNSRRASCVKIQTADKFEFAQVKFYFYGSINDERRTLALVLFFSDPDADLLQDSQHTVHSVKYLPRATGLRVIDAKTIISVVAAIPHDHKIGNETEQRYFIWEQMGMEIALQIETVPEEVDNEEL